MDLESLKDRRNRFQVNRVDSVAAGQHRGLNSSLHNGDGSAGSNNNDSGNIGVDSVGFKDFHIVENNHAVPASTGTKCVNDNYPSRNAHTNPGMGVGNGREEQSRRTSSMSDRKGKKYGPLTNRTTSFDIPEGADIDGPWNSPAKLISATNTSMEHASGTNSSGHPYTHTNSVSYDTKYGKSFRHFTREALPRLDNYRNMMSIQAAYRPTLDELHDMTLQAKVSSFLRFLFHWNLTTLCAVSLVNHTCRI